MLAGIGVAIVTLYVINPPWWTEPIYALKVFFSSNLGRSVTVPIKTQFLGQVISTPDGSLPWYNTLLWTVFVTPVGFLVLALAGVGRALRRWRVEPFGLLAIGHWAFLLLLRALPHVPGHDGVRQFLPAFGVLALVAGLGAASAIERLGRWGQALVAAALIEGAVSVALLMPVPLSYYSPIIGGLPGAAKLGMEPTYYWDSLSDEALDWLNTHTRSDQRVRFATYPSSFLYLSQVGRMPGRWLRPADSTGWAWYVLQNRPGAFRPGDRALAVHGRPAFVVRKWGVPLLWIFPYEQLEALPVRVIKTPRPTTARSIRAAAGRGSSAWKRGQSRSLTRGVSLGRSLRGSILRSGVDDRGRGAAGPAAGNRLAQAAFLWQRPPLNIFLWPQPPRCLNRPHFGAGAQTGSGAQTGAGGGQTGAGAAQATGSQAGAPHFFLWQALASAAAKAPKMPARARVSKCRFI